MRFIAIAAAVLGLAAVAHGSAGDVAATVDPAIANIRTTLGYEGGAAAGTGIVIGSSGLVLTNNHVIRGATSIRVTDIGNGRTYSATVLGYDVANDVALLQLKGASGLKTATIGGDAGLGQVVTALGNAGGRGGTPSVASGTVTGLNRAITAGDGEGNAERLTGLIETNVALEPGDSGGPLVDSAGRVLGINTAASVGFEFNTTSSSDAYAIPIAHALAIAKQIQSGKGTSTTHVGATPMLGVSVGFGGFGYDSVAGAYVQSVLPGSPAGRAGLVAGDVITAVDGRSISTQSVLSGVMLNRSPGQSVVVKWVDAFNTLHSASVKLATGPAQ